ncbi:amidohydrolase family protein [Plectosphaerella plurivora]|uniref:Amidohydrolase family protein n=1 Tax=Plectosphaerella plurivora TaxID=936078 RepID=A0A9P8VIP2_9PEZI|nr:amidohydrolase family protein [Plectosphaerella plurivora]
MTDLLLTNGRILTRTHALLHDEPTFADSMLVRDGVIVAVGTQSEVAAQASSSDNSTVETRDLAQKTILPGFVDGHVHLLLLGQSLRKVSVGHCKTLDDILETLKAYATANPDVPRILAKDWMHSMTPDGATAAMLDAVDSRPIFVDTKDLHSTWCNTAGLDEMGIADMPDPAGGIIHRDEQGRPSGVLSEGAVLSIVWPHQAQVSPIEERQAAMLAAIETYNESGYTGLIEMAMDGPAWEAVVALRASRPDLPMRIAAYWLIKPSDTPEQRLAQVQKAVELHAELNASTSPDLRIAGIKVVCDGIIDACTAYLSEPYAPAASPPPIWSREDLVPVVQAAEAAGLQIALHAIGDAAIKMAVDVLEAHTTPGRRHRIEHIELSSPEDARRLGELGLTASIQPVHADPAILRAWPRLIGSERCKRAFAYREFADAGALMALGSDSPTAPWAPLRNIYVATTRRSAREPDSDEVVNENFRLGVCEAVVAGTRGAAASVFADERTGSLEAGKVADFLVVDMDWTTEGLLKGEILETYFGGRQVFARK